LNVFRTRAIKIVFADIYPAIGYIKTVRKDSLIDNDTIRPAVMLNGVDGAFGSRMHRRDPNVDRI
jgi:hypothetical protein